MMMQAAESTSECACVFAHSSWQHSAHCRWSHCRHCAWRCPIDVTSEAGLVAFADHFRDCAGRAARAHLCDWLASTVRFGASIQDIVGLFPDRGPFHEKHCAIAADVTNFACRELWLPLSAVLGLFFPSLAADLAAATSPSDGVVFSFQDGYGLRMVSFRFEEATPVLAAYFAFVLQLRLTETTRALRASSYLEDDEACIVALTSTTHKTGGRSRRQATKATTWLEFVDARMPPANDRDYVVVCDRTEHDREA
ncbi:hypothetical protein SDRG_10259 [Saprolegnia diclina VS20]|uniref:Uncharacterized protein n=1 Tax=Saprolegnia diclina (strain VS20) TaxID=1156394 RepID=T0RPY7_SAPDV|nr:hypothetical protein SDRG_10259 [Saprolegnia diclina VS20]EQC32062.1 hypothetical protein SDRG_10259 [Saprolegnia diclina VS20]|eukprot:XP_008614464.1 hypothetical protein SDRG_10259 [Saprolegnia diclina VS20]